VFLHDLHYRVILANAAYCRAAGVSEADALGKPYWEVFPPGPGPRPGCRAATHGKDRTPSPEDLLVWEKYFSSVDYVVPDDQGRPLYFLHVLTDITEQRRTEAALRESEARFRTVIDTAQDAIISLDGESDVITAANLASERIFGYSREELIGQSLHGLLMPARFLEANAQDMAEFARTGEGAAVGRTVELVALHKDGTEFPIELSLSATHLHGTWFATGIARDISGRKRGEALQRDLAAKYSAMFESSSDAIMLLDDDVLIDCNAAAVRMFGGSTSDDLTAGISSGSRHRPSRVAGTPGAWRRGSSPRPFRREASSSSGCIAGSTAPTSSPMSC
jgi:PAS domain S-box-containing protein